MFEGTHENPELIWNEEGRSKVQAEVRRIKDEHYVKQRQDPSIVFTVSHSFI